MDVDGAIAATDSVETLPPVQPVVPKVETRASLSIRTKEQLLEAKDEMLFLEVRPWVFGCIWSAMLVLHIVCGTFLALQARLYMYLTRPSLAYYVHFIDPSIVRKYQAFAIVFGVFSLIHWNVVLKLCINSVRQQKLAFFPVPIRHIKPLQHVENALDDKSLPCRRRIQLAIRRLWRRVNVRIHSLHLSLFSRRGVFGVESRFFYLYFYTREAIELTSQIYQAYRASLLVGATWLTNLFVAVIVVNCLSTPLVQYRYKSRPELRRILLLAIDASLDFIMAIIIPVIILAPYAKLFDPTTATFPISKTYDATWFVNAVLENQEVFCVSVMDLCFKMVPHVSITGCLRKVRALVHKDTSVRVSNRGSRVFNDVLSPANQAKQFESRVAAFQATKYAQQLHVIEELEEQAQAHHGHVSGWRYQVCKYLLTLRRVLSRVFHKYANKLARLIFIGIGIGIICIQYFSYRNEEKQLLQSTTTPLGCTQRMRPWFATKLACSVYEFNCHTLGTDGAAADVAMHLERLHPGAVVGLVFSHCPALEMPQVFANFSHLMLLDIYNCTITSWPDGATAITSATHPRLSTMSLIRVNFTNGELPAGLVDEDFPTGLVDIEIVASNLQDLPTNLHITWKSMHRVFIEHTPQMAHIPSTILLWQIEQLSLASNAITALPVKLMSGGRGANSYRKLALIGNPISELPVTVSDTFAAQYLFLQRTNVSAMPAWVSNKLENGNIARVFAARTPFCDTEAVTNPEVLAADAPITCNEFVLGIGNGREDDGDDLLSVVDQGGLVPLTYIDELNAILE